jgi:Rrf2 family iron-sulfur cluster assembly transcriptional regulator
MLSQSVGYAAAALGVIADAEGKPLLIRVIAEAAEVPTPYLAKLIHILGRKGVVETQRGIGGGVVFVGDPKKFTLYDLCVCLDDPVTKKRCMLGSSDCSDERACPCHKFWVSHRDKEIEFLKRTTIADLGNFKRKELVRQGKRSAR